MREVMGVSKNRDLIDFYATPIDEVRNILSKEFIYTDILDPCCGQGNISIAVKELYQEQSVISTDIAYRGYGEKVELNFLSDNYPFKHNIGTIIMNPPFCHITEFIIKALTIAPKVIVLARTQLLEGKERYEKIYKINPPNYVYQYIDRVTCHKNGITQKGCNSMSYAWFVWDRVSDITGYTKIRWINKHKEIKQ